MQFSLKTKGQGQISRVFMNTFLSSHISCGSAVCADRHMDRRTQTYMVSLKQYVHVVCRKYTYDV